MRHWIYGRHAVEAALMNPDRKIYQLCLSKTAAGDFGASISNVRPQTVDIKFFQDKFGTQAVHQGIAAEVESLEPTYLEDVLEDATQDESSLILILDQVTDPHNVGAILRTATALGVKAILVTDYKSADLLSPVLIKTASGAYEMTPIISVTNLAQGLSALKKAGYWLVGLAEGGDKSLPELDLQGHWGIVLGAEGTGIRRLTRESCDFIAHLPTAEDFSTLNVSNAAAIAAYEFFRQNNLD